MKKPHKPKKPKALFREVKNGELIGDCELHGKDVQMIILRYKDKVDENGDPLRYYACRKCAEGAK